MTVQPVQPQIFISYCWTNPAHEQWVLELATKLTDDDVLVRFDKWDLKEGHDKYAFMESMVTSKDIDKVLIICDSGYKRKADKREGGVGTETQIITPELYGNADQEKFIPILAERDEKGKEVFPAFISSRIYIDLSSEDYFEENYEKLLRSIYKAPLYKRPPQGKAPSFLFEDNSPQFQTSIILRKMNTARERDPKRLKYLWNEFAESFFESMEQLKIETIPDSSEIDELVVEKINLSAQLKEDYVKALTMMQESEMLDSEHMIEFFEELNSFTEFSGSGSYNETQMDQYKFLLHELFLYSVAILLKNKSYSLLTELLYAEYHLKSKFASDRKHDFISFRAYLKSLEYRKHRLQSRQISLQADMLVQRASKKLKEELLSADIILHYISKLCFEDNWGWFPVTYVYFEANNGMKFISKLKSRKHFESVKTAFNVDNVQQLSNLLKEYDGERGYQLGIRSIPNIRDYINPEEICILP